MMTETQAHAALAGYDSFDRLEPRIAEQPWMAVPGGWSVAGELQGWRYRLDGMPGGVRVIAPTPDGGRADGVDRAEVVAGHGEWAMAQLARAFEVGVPDK